MRVTSNGLLIFAAAAALAQPRPDVAARRFDFGYINKGEKVTHLFAVKNTGAADLVIKAVAPT